MATKSEKKKAEAYRRKEKEAKKRMANLGQQQIDTMMNYVIYQILYVNDAACNQCKFLGDTLKTIPYKGKGAKIIYGALMKRVNLYWSMVNNVLDVNLDSLAELMSEMDEYMDKGIYEMRNAIKNVLTRYNIENPDWVAQVETARTVVSYAVQVAKDYIDSLASITKESLVLKPLIITEIEKVMDSFAQFIQEAAHMGKIAINLNEDEGTVKAFRHFNKAFVKPENFIKASNNADAVNVAEGRIKLM